MPGHITPWSRLRRPRVLLALAALTAVLLLAMRWFGNDAGFGATVLQHPFDERPNGYDPAQALAVMDGMDDLQYRAYIRYRLLDLLLPPVLGALLAGCLAALGAPRLARLAVVAAACDVLENAALWLMLWQEVPALGLVTTASALTQLKWVAYGLTLGALGVVLAQRWLRGTLLKGQGHG